mgnify:CR=1 FL=1|tara:strand:- start:2930 stop:3541 length:612 start_codon:yes stop_codon:yes gene_type:complete
MIKKIIIFLVILIFGVTCSNHNSTIFLKNTHKLVYKRSQCDSNKKFPQMILIPYFETATQVVPDCRTYPVHQTALALFVFYHQWLEYFEDNNMAVRGMLEKVMISWGTKKRTSSNGFNLKGEPFENRNILGIVESENMIWVWQGYNHRISESALFHELVHLAIRAKNGDHGDPDHEGFKYRGWTPTHSRMIIETKQMLRAFEL